MINWDEIKIRCSAIGCIMTEPQSKEARLRGELSKTAKTYLKQLYAELKYGRTRDIQSKYTDKGKLAEGEAIEMLSFLDDADYEKNQIRFENDFLSGIPDIAIIGVKAIDNKSSWDLFTHLAFAQAELEKEYEWQIKGYMELTDAPIGEVSRCLVNTPESIIEDEARRMLYKMNVISEESPEFKEAYREIIHNMTFDDIPYEQRRIKWTFERDETEMQPVYERVIKCREWLKEFDEYMMNQNKTLTAFS
jgi:hypothetical protein